MARRTKPPATLGEAGRRFWNRVAREFELDLASLDTLEQAALALDRSEAARVQIELDGMLVKDRFGQPRAHPLCTVERDSRSAFRLLTNQLGLHLEATGEQGRPVED